MGGRDKGDTSFFQYSFFDFQIYAAQDSKSLSFFFLLGSSLDCHDRDCHISPREHSLFNDN